MCKKLGITLPTENTLNGLELPKQVQQVKKLVFIALVHDSKETADNDKLFEGYHIIEKETVRSDVTANEKKQIDIEESSARSKTQPASTMPEITEENVLAIFESKNANVIIHSDSGLEIDRFIVTDYLKRIRLLKRYEPEVIDQKVNAAGKIIELIIKEKSN